MKKKNKPIPHYGVRGWLGLYWTKKQWDKYRKKVLKTKLP